MINFSEKGFNRAIIKYEYLIKLIITQFNLRTCDYDEALQEGRLGLYKAIKSYDFDKGSSFITYASLCIKRNLISFLRSYSNLSCFTKRKHIFVEHFDEEIHQVYKHGNTLENFIFSKNQFEDIHRRVFKQINPVERQIYSDFMVGYTVNEISVDYDTPKRKVYSIIAKTKKKIEDKLNET